MSGKWADTLPHIALNFLHVVNEFFPISESWDRAKNTKCLPFLEFSLDSEGDVIRHLSMRYYLVLRGLDLHTTKLGYSLLLFKNAIELVLIAAAVDDWHLYVRPVVRMLVITPHGRILKVAVRQLLLLSHQFYIFIR